MAKLFKGKYRIPSARAPWWDYGWNAPYFITICTHNRRHFFGEIVDGAMQLSAVGRLAERLWYEIPDQFPYARLDAWVVMPNHVHGILVIDKLDDDGGVDRGCGRDAINSVSTGAAGAEKTGGITGHHNPMLHDNLGRIVRWYKGRTTFESRKIRPNFTWQTRYYDNIIRNYASLDNIRRYIQNNPINWMDDRFYV